MFDHKRLFKNDTRALGDKQLGMSFEMIPERVRTTTGWPQGIDRTFMLLSLVKNTFQTL
jgi:hypothetical protein